MVYDSLVGTGVLAKVPTTARLIDVGKRADKHTMPQEQINQVLLEEAQKGQRVVRLKVVTRFFLEGAEKNWNF